MSGLHPYFFFPSLSHFTLAQEKEGEKDLNTQGSVFLSLPAATRGERKERKDEGKEGKIVRFLCRSSRGKCSRDMEVCFGKV